MCKLGVISQERLKIQVKLLLTANRKSYMPRRLAQQRMTLSDLEWLSTSSTLKSTSSASCAISAVAELLVLNCKGGFILFVKGETSYQRWLISSDRCRGKVNMAIVIRTIRSICEFAETELFLSSFESTVKMMQGIFWMCLYYNRKYCTDDPQTHRYHIKDKEGVL